MNPRKEVELQSGSLIKLLQPLCGLADSGDYWNQTLSQHLQEYLDMRTTAKDMSFFFHKVGEKLRGFVRTYFYDSLFTGNHEFLRHTDKTIQKFATKAREFDNSRFAGVYIEKKDDGLLVHQQSYIDRLQLLSSSCAFEEFQSSCAQLTWLIHTRLDICTSANMLAQVTADRFGANAIKQYNKIVLHLKRTNT